MTATVGRYFGAVAAFSGGVLVLLPPRRQLRAATLGQTLAVVLILHYGRSLRQQSDGRASARVNAPPPPALKV